MPLIVLLLLQELLTYTQLEINQSLYLQRNLFLLCQKEFLLLDKNRQLVKYCQINHHFLKSLHLSWDPLLKKTVHSHLLLLSHKSYQQFLYSHCGMTTLVKPVVYFLLLLILQEHLPFPHQDLRHVNCLCHQFHHLRNLIPKQNLVKLVSQTFLPDLELHHRNFQVNHHLLDLVMYTM